MKPAAGKVKWQCATPQDGVRFLERSTWFHKGADLLKQHCRNSVSAWRGLPGQHTSDIESTGTGTIKFNRSIYLRSNPNHFALSIASAEFSSVYLLSFSLELSLKAVYCFSHSRYPRTHDIQGLFECLGESTLQEIVSLCNHEWNLSRKEIDLTLGKHKNLFEDVRYPDDPDGVNLASSDHTNLIRLNHCSIGLARSLAKDSGAL